MRHSQKIIPATGFPCLNCLHLDMFLYLHVSCILLPLIWTAKVVCCFSCLLSSVYFKILKLLIIKRANSSQTNYQTSWGCELSLAPRLSRCVCDTCLHYLASWTWKLLIVYKVPGQINQFYHATHLLNCDSIKGKKGIISSNYLSLCKP